MNISNLEQEVIQRFHLTIDVELLRSCNLYRELWCDESMLVIDCPSSLIARHIWDSQQAIAKAMLKTGISRKYVIRVNGKVFRPVLSL